MTTTLFIGLGRMGLPMAIRHARQFSTAVFDLSADAVAEAAAHGATAIESISPPPDGIDTVILMLPTSRHVEGTLSGPEGLLRRLARGALVIDMGSSEPDSTRMLAAEAAALHLDYVDAPVSGGVPKATSGELAIMAGGTAAAVARARPHLEMLGSSILHVGPAGCGHAAKALNNLVSASNIAVACEALSIATQFGISAETMTTVLNEATGRSQATEVKFPRYIIPGTYDSGFAYDLMVKDMTIAIGMRGDLHTPVVDAAFQNLSHGRPSLGDAPDHTEIARLYPLGTTPPHEGVDHD